MKYFKRVLYISIVILFYQGIANTDLSIISQLTHQHGNSWAGPLSTALLFIGSGTGSIYNKYIGKYPYRYLMFIGSFGYTIFIAMGIVFMKLKFSTLALVLIEFGSLVGGLIVSVLYNTQFNYVNVLSKIDRQQVKYFGILLVFTQASNVYGSLLSALLIQPLGQFTYVVVMDIAIFVISLFFLGIKDPDHEDLNTLIEQSPDSSPENDAHDKRSMLSSSSQNEDSCCNWEPYKIIACFIYTGIIVAFIYNTLSIILYRTFQDKMSETELNRLTFIIFIFQGIGEIIGGLLVTFLSAKIKAPAKVYIAIATLFIFAFGIVYLGSVLESYYVIGFGAIVCGLCDCSNMSVALTIAGNWQKDGITAFNIGQCFSVAVCTMLMVIIPTEFISILVGVLYIFCVVSLCKYMKKIQQ